MTKAPVSLQDQRLRLYIKAKAEPGWRFWGLYVHVCKRETLREAYRLAKSNGGAPGIDGVTFEAIEAEGTEAYLDRLREELEQRSYRPQRARKVEIPKEGGKVRQLSIPTVSAYCTSYNTASESPRVSFRILEERRTHLSNSRSFSPLTVIQYGEPPVSLRASIRLRSIQ